MRARWTGAFAEKWASAKELAAMAAEIQTRVDADADFALASPFPAPEELLTDVYA